MEPRMMSVQHPHQFVSYCLWGLWKSHTTPPIPKWYPNGLSLTIFLCEVCLLVFILLQNIRVRISLPLILEREPALARPRDSQGAEVGLFETFYSILKFLFKTSRPVTYFRTFPSDRSSSIQTPSSPTAAQLA